MIKKASRPSCTANYVFCINVSLTFINQKLTLIENSFRGEYETSLSLSWNKLCGRKICQRPRLLPRWLPQHFFTFLHPHHYFCAVCGTKRRYLSFSHTSTLPPFPAPFHSSTLHVNVSLAHLMDVFCTLKVLVNTNRRLLPTATLVCVWYLRIYDACSDVGNAGVCQHLLFFWECEKNCWAIGFDVIFSSFFLLCAEWFASLIRNVAMPYHHHDSVYFIIFCLISILINFIYFQSLIFSVSHDFQQVHNLSSSSL